MNFRNLNSIEEYYEEECLLAGGPFSTDVEAANWVEAKETWWEYNHLLDQLLADDESDRYIPPEIYDLKDRWV